MSEVGDEATIAAAPSLIRNGDRIPCRSVCSSSPVSDLDSFVSAREIVFVETRELRRERVKRRREPVPLALGMQADPGDEEKLGRRDRLVHRGVGGAISAPARTRSRRSPNFEASPTGRA